MINYVKFMFFDFPLRSYTRLRLLVQIYKNLDTKILVCDLFCSKKYKNKRGLLNSFENIRKMRYLKVNESSSSIQLKAKQCDPSI